MELFGRRRIFSTAESVTAENVVPLLNEQLPLHSQNLQEEDFLFWYRRGIQPAWNRKKAAHPRYGPVAENHAAEIVAFRNRLFLARAAGYSSRRNGGERQVEKLNRYVANSGKRQADREMADWVHTVGVGNLYVAPNRDPEAPVNVYALDPRSSFVAYSQKPGNEPVMGVHIALVGKEKSGAEQAVFDVFTKQMVFRVFGRVTGRFVPEQPVTATAVALRHQEPNRVGEIPIIEYQGEANRMGSFEAVVPLLDAINRSWLDGVEQGWPGLVPEPLEQAQGLADSLYQRLWATCPAPAGGTDWLWEDNRYFDRVLLQILNRKTDLDLRLEDIEWRADRPEPGIHGGTRNQEKAGSRPGREDGLAKEKCPQKCRAGRSAPCGRGGQTRRKWDYPAMPVNR